MRKPPGRRSVELKPEHRAALLAIAARRGEKGFSSVLEDAVGAYLDQEEARDRRCQDLLDLAGSVSPEDAEELRRETRGLRASWR